MKKIALIIILSILAYHLTQSMNNDEPYVETVVLGSPQDIFKGIEKNDSNQVKYSLEFFPKSVNARNQIKSYTPLMVAMINVNSRLRNVADIPLMIMRAKPDIDLTDEDGNTALHHAVLKANSTHEPFMPGFIKWLMVHGANNSIVNKLGKTPKDLALEGGIPEVIKMFSSLPESSERVFVETVELNEL